MLHIVFLFIFITNTFSMVSSYEDATVKSPIPKVLDISFSFQGEGQEESDSSFSNSYPHVLSPTNKYNVSPLTSPAKRSRNSSRSTAEALTPFQTPEKDTSTDLQREVFPCKKDASKRLYPDLKKEEENAKEESFLASIPQGPPKLLQDIPIEQILTNCKGCLIDIWGTIYNDEELLPGAKQLISTLESQKIPYAFISNSSKGRKEAAEKLLKAGLFWEEVFGIQESEYQKFINAENDLPLQDEMFVLKDKQVKDMVREIASKIITVGDWVQWQLVHQQFEYKKQNFFDNLRNKNNLGAEEPLCFFHIDDEQNQGLLKPIFNENGDYVYSGSCYKEVCSCCGGKRTRTPIKKVSSIEEAHFVLTSLAVTEKKAQESGRAPPFFGWEDVFEKALRKGLPMIVANPDIISLKPEGNKYCAGYWGGMYEKRGQEMGVPVEVYRYGKPFEGIYEEGCKKLQEQSLKTSSPKPKHHKQIVMFGDSLHLDGIGAIKNHHQFTLVLTGVTGTAYSNEDLMEYFIKLLEENKLEKPISPTYVLKNLEFNS